MRIRSLNFATSIDVLPTGAIVEDRGPYVVVRSPSNPTHYWGNFLLYREPPVVGDRERWEHDFAREVKTGRHLAFGWDITTGELGAARDEFLEAGYELGREATLVATPDGLRAHARASHDVRIRQLDPTPGVDEDGWAAAYAVQLANRDEGHAEADYAAFLEARTSDRRKRFCAGQGAWFIAEDAASGVAVASCGVIVTDGRARFQSVDVVEAARRRGVASRLVYEAGRAAVEQFGARQLVIVADVDYHALALYESLGFVPCEQSVGVCWWPTAPRAGRHPDRGSGRN